MPIGGHPWKHKIDLRGHRFGRLVVSDEAPPRGERGTKARWVRRWICQCDCGATKTVGQKELRSGDTTSCGCLQRETLAERRRTHGRRHSTEYNIWHSMKQRCFNPKSKFFADYGGRGISVCTAWRDSFEAFFADMGPRPDSRYTIDRMDNDGPYTRDNCRWATRIQQAQNRRKRHDGTLLTHDGRTQTLRAWAEEFGINKHTLYCRLERGWPSHRALSA